MRDNRGRGRRQLKLEEGGEAVAQILESTAKKRTENDYKNSKNLATDSIKDVGRCTITSNTIL